ncbi:MAG: 1-deoxy-D-xylulose 5-phosphate reductoisomerase, partial [Acidobacteriota bacterium]
MPAKMTLSSHRKQVAILGSTGSIGCNTLRVIEAFADEFEVA